MKKRIISFVLVACIACALFVPGASALGEIIAPQSTKTFSFYPPATEDFIPETVQLLREDICKEVCENPALLSGEAIPFAHIICNDCKKAITTPGKYIGSYNGPYVFGSSTCYYRYDQFRFTCSCGWSVVMEEPTSMPHVWGSYDSGGTRYCDNCHMGDH